MTISKGSVDILKGNAIISNPNYFARYASPEQKSGIVRGNQVLPSSVDEFIADREVARVNRQAREFGGAMRSAYETPSVLHMAGKWIEDHANQKNCPQVVKDFMPEGRVNATLIGEAFAGQLTSVVPFYFTEPTRGISFDFIPKIMQGGLSGQDIKLQAYSGRQGNFEAYGENPTTFSTIEVENNEINVGVVSLIKATEIGFKETAFVAEYSSMSKYPNYNPNLGFVNPIVAKMDYLDKYYKLCHDSIAWYGSQNPATQDTSLGFVNVMTSSDIPSYTAPGGTFVDLTTDEKSNLLVDLGNQILRQSLTNLTADTLFIDLYSFTQLMNGYTQYKDTVTLNNMIANGMFQAIIPVAAWSQINPTQTTMIACNNQVATWFYNLACPLTALNPELRATELTIPYITRTSGMTIVNSLGLARLTMPLGTIGTTILMNAGSKRLVDKINKTRNDQVKNAA